MTYRDRDRVMRWLEAGHGEKLTLLDRVILRDLAEAANSETGHAWLGQDTLSARWGRDTRSIQRSIARLHDRGLLITAESGRWHRRARYALAGEVARVTEVSPYEDPHRVTEVSPYGADTGRHPGRNRATPVSQQGDTGVADRVTDGSPVSVVNTDQSINHHDDDDDGALRALAPSMDGIGIGPNDPTPQWAIEADLLKAAAEGDRSELMDIVAGEREMVQEIAARLEMSEDDAEDWIVDTLEGRQIKTSVKSYLRACMKNYTPPARQGPTETCTTHWLDLPCRGCAADRKAAPSQQAKARRSQQTNGVVTAIKKIAAILGDDVELHVDDEDDFEYGLTRAGLYLVVGNSWDDPTLITVWAEHAEDSPWPEDKPLPDEPFHNLAVKDGGGYRLYRPDDAIALAEHWHQATQVGATP